MGDEGSLIAMGSLNLLNADGSTYNTIISLAIVICAVAIMGVLTKKGVKGAVLWPMLGATVLYYAFMGLGLAWSDTTSEAVFNSFGMSNPFSAFEDWGNISVGRVFSEGFDFSHYLQTHSGGELALIIITSALALCTVDMFDTLGTLYGAAARGNMLDKDGNVPNMNRAMLCDAIATSVGSVCGTSTVTTFVESSAGVGAGARTGFSSLFVALCFFVTMFLSPVAQLVQNVSTASALIFVGILMMGGVKDVEWSDPADAVPAFLTIVMMPFTGNISYGIAFGIISYMLIKLFMGKVKEIKITTVIIGALFIATFLLSH